MKKRNKDTAPVQNRSRKNWIILAVIGMLLIGSAVFLYPRFTEKQNSSRASNAISSYNEALSKMSEEDYEREINRALTYNRRMADTGIEWKELEDPDEYASILNIIGDGLMGYMKIDKIDVTVPIYHTAKDDVLRNGIGHLENTSFPVGAKSYDSNEERVMDPRDGSQCVLSTYSEKSDTKLFSGLDRMNEGDAFSIYIMGETFTYQVDQIRVVAPSDIEELNIVRGADYCTLMGNTSDGGNAHILLVRGIRVNNPQGDASVMPDAELVKNIFAIPFIAVLIILILILTYIFRIRKKY